MATSGAFLRKRNGHRPADAAVTAADQGDLTLEFAGRQVLASLGLGPGPHRPLTTGLLLLLRRDSFNGFRCPFLRG